MSGEVGQGQALVTVVRVLGPVQILFRGDYAEFDHYEKVRMRAWKETVRRWMRGQRWYGSRGWRR